MKLFLVIAAFFASCSAFMAPSALKMGVASIRMNADDPNFHPTRDPTPTVVDPNDPKGKQKAIHAAPSFAEYMAMRGGGAAAPAPAPAAPAPAAPAPAPAASPFDEYMAKRGVVASTAPVRGPAHTPGAGPKARGPAHALTQAAQGSTSYLNSI